MNQRAPLVLCGVIWAGYIALLAFVPWWIPPPTDLPNVASVLGYNISLAYILVIGWTAVMGLITAAVLRSTPLPSAPSGSTQSELGPLQRWLERGAVAVGALIFYWPGALARFGPHVEDVYFLNVLWRRFCGAVAYRDFEFLYGPLMLAPAEAAMAILGFSMQSYFTYLALTQVVFFAVLMAILQRYIPRALPRYLAFLLLLPFVIDLLYGLNWIAWRYFGVVIALLILSARPRAFGAVVMAGILIGLQAAYSHEYGIAGLLSGATVLGLGLFEPARGRAIALLGTFIGTALICWGAVVVGLTGQDFSAYLEMTLFVMSQASSKGLGQFAFHWTGHSLALFAVLSFMVVLGGIGLSRLGRVQASEGDRHIIGALVFALIVLKVGFQRVDFLHMAVPFVPLALMLLLGAERQLLATGPLIQRLSITALALAAIAQTIGHIPQGRWVVLGLVRGVLHEAQSRPTADVPPTANAGILAERSDRKPAVELLASRLAEPDLVDRPVLFYGNIWNWAVETGSCPAGYAFYDLLYTDELSPMIDLTNSTPDILVALHERNSGLLESAAQTETSTPPEFSKIRRLIHRIASPHYNQSYLEDSIETQMWNDAFGSSLASDYRIVDQVGDVILLEPNQ